MKRPSLFTKKNLVPILAVSLSQIARAASFDTAQTGVWSDPLSWTAGVGFPDTYGSDSALINAGHVIDYTGGMTTPAGLVGPGGFAIANSNTVLIDGGTLTQLTLTNEMRIGEGTGAADGIGTLTIQAGGTLNTGTSIGLAVGTKIGGAVGGDGLLDIKDGFLTLGAGAVAGGFGVGIESSTGVLKVGDGSGAAGSAVVDLATNNIQMGIGANPGALGGGTGTVTVDADGLINFGTGNIYVGQGGGNGTLNILSGGTITGTDGAILVGDGAGSVGALSNAGTIGTSVVSTGEVRIGGGGGAGTFTMTAGTLTTTGEFNMGRDAGSVGTGTLSGGTMSVGLVRIGRDGGTATLAISGGTLADAGNLNVGTDGGVGVINQTAGSVTYNAWSAIGVGAGGTGSQWNISGGSITAVANAGFEVGSDRDGAFNVSGTANVNVGALQAGVRTGSSGTINVTGGTVVTTGLQIAGAQSGGATGVANISGGAATSFTINTGSGQSFVGDKAGSFGTLNITGLGTVVNDVSGEDFQVGRDGGTGNLNVTGGGQLNLNWWLNVARGAGSAGNVLVDGAGSAINISGPGTGGNAGRNDIHSNIGEDGTGVMTVSNGGAFVHNNNPDYRTFVGRNGGSNGTLNVNTGGTFDVTELSIAGNGGATGLMNIASGGKVTTQNWFVVGQGGGASGTVNIDGAGSLLDTRSPLFLRNGGAGGDSQIGYQGGTGIVNVTNGGKWQNGWWVNIARDAGSNGTVTVDGVGSQLIIGQQSGLGGPDARLNVGEQGTGTLNISNGGLVMGNTETAVGQNGGSVGLLNVSTGGTFTTGNWLIIGNSNGATGTVNLSDAGSSINLTGEYDGGGNLGERSRLFIGRSGSGTLNQTGGTITFGGWSAIGLDRGSNGTYNMSGGLLQTRPEFDFDWFVGRQNGDGVTAAAQGTLNVSGTANFDMLTDAANGDPGGRNGMRLNVGAGHDGTTFDAQGTVNVTGGTLSVLSFTVGDNGKATVTQNGGTVNVGQWLEIGQGNAPDSAANEASYTLNDGILNAQQIVVGSRRAGTMTVNGGIINLGNDGTVQVNNWGDFAVGRDGGGADHGDGHLIVTGGIINGNGKNLQISRGGPNTKGLMDMSGGDINGLNQLSIGEGGSTNATVNFSGGTISTINEVRVGQGAGTVATFNISGTAALTSGGEFQVGNGLGTGTVNMTGGTVTANSWVAIGRDGGTGTFNLSGGTFTKTAGTGTVDIGVFGGTVGFQVNNYATADTVIAGGPEQAFSFTANYTTSSTSDNGDGGGNFGVGAQVQGLPAGDNNNFAFVGLGNFTVDVTGSYVFGNNTNDGSRLRLSINGGVFNEIITDNVLSGPHDAFSAPITLTLGDTIALDWMWFENGGGAEGESFYSRDGGPNALWEDSTQGLTLAGGQYSGTVYKAASSFVVGTGTLNMSGTGALINTGSDTNIARDGGSIGVWNMTSATATATLATLNIGNGGDGTLNLTAGTITTTGVFVARNGGSVGKLQGDGGIIETPFVEVGGGAATVNFNGVTLRASQDEGNYLRNFNPGNSEVQAGGLILDTNGFNVTVLNDFDGTGGVRKTGSGTLNLEGLQGYATLTTTAGTTNLDNALGTGTSTLNANATTNISVSETLAALNIGTVPFAPPEAGLGGGKASAVVPEPAAFGLLMVGALGILARRRRKQG